QQSDPVVRLDVDLCDPRGNICALMRGSSWRRAPDGVGHAVQPAAPARREIALQTASAPAERKRPAPISLAVPGASAPTAPRYGRTPIVLSATDVHLPLHGSPAPAMSAVKLHDEGNGIFSIDVTAAGPNEIITGLPMAMEKVQQEPSIRVLVLRGLERGFERGGRERANQA